MIDVRREFSRQVCAVTPEVANWLKGQGVPRDVIYAPAARTVAVDRITVHGDLYEPDPGGRPALIVPVSYEYEAGWFEPVDAAAWFPGAPARIYRRTDVAAILNPVSVEYAAHFEEPLALWSSPLAWLQGGLCGAVIVDWRAHLGLHLGGLQILCDCPALADRLTAKVIGEQRDALPTIRAREVRDAA